jgi:RNA polymerase sigma-70 factor (ECF subfamily)
MHENVLGPSCDVQGALLPTRDELNGNPPGSLAAKIVELFGELRMPLFRYMVVALGSAEEAEDATQECFLRLCRHLQQGGQVKNERLWLFHVAHNLLLDQKKSGRALHEILPPDWDIVAATHSDSAPDQEQRLLAREKYETLQSAFSELTEQQREVLRLREEGLGYREIAEVLSSNVPVVAAHIRRAVAKIKAKLNV